MLKSTISGIVVMLIVGCGGATTGGGQDSEDDYRLQTNLDGSATGNGSMCTYGGQVTSVGETFKAPDGCNDCRCTARGAACTARACGSGGACVYDGKMFQPGESWTVPNPTCPAASARCRCDEGGHAACAAPTIACADPGQCSPDACGPAPGMPNIQCADGTLGGPSCEMHANGTCGWTIRSCTCKGNDGNVYKPGESWSDGCNNCKCADNGGASCTKKACKCPPDGTINCMPVIPKERVELCSGPYRKWVQANCPGVKYLD